MRILHIVHQYPPDHVGGTEFYTQTLAAYQQRAGHEVAIFCPASRTATTVENGIRVHRISDGGAGRTKVFASTFYQPTMQRALTAVIAQSPPDIIHIQHLMGLPSRIINDIRAAGIPYVITLHDYWYGCANAQLIINGTDDVCTGADANGLNCARCALTRAEKSSWGWLAPALSPIMRQRNGRLQQIIKNAAYVIAPTEFVRTAYAQMGLAGKNMIVITHGIELPQAQIKAALANRSARKAGQLRIGYVGSLGWQKGLHHLIAAVNRLPAAEVTVDIYGGLDTFPDYVADLQAMATHTGIRFNGRISREQIWQAFANMDIFAFPTLWYEASPLTIDEAFAARTPILASDIGAVGEKVKDGIDGLLVPPGDEEALYHALRRLLDDSTLLETLRENIQPVRTMQNQSQEIEALYKTLL